MKLEVQQQPLSEDRVSFDLALSDGISAPAFAYEAMDDKVV